MQAALSSTALIIISTAAREHRSISSQPSIPDGRTVVNTRLQPMLLTDNAVDANCAWSSRNGAHRLVGWQCGSRTTQRSALVETETTLIDTNQVSEQTFGYDDSVPFNNQTT